MHVSVAEPPKYVQVPVTPLSEHAMPGERVDVVEINGATHVAPDGENTHAAGNSAKVHAVPARLKALDAARG